MTDMRSAHDSLPILVWWLGSKDVGANEYTWGEFVQANPDMDENEKQQILNTILAGRPYNGKGPDGMYGIKTAEGTMRKTNENASMGAVSAGNIGTSTGSPNAFMVSRVKEEDGDEEAEDMKLNDEDINEGVHVEFVRNGVPYAGRIMEVFDRYVLISTGGRRMQVERNLIENALAAKNGAPEPVGPGPTRYGVKTAKQDHAQSSPTTPNRTMQKFVGGETLGSVGTFETLGQNDGQGELPGMQTPKQGNFETTEVTGPAHWASALINGDRSGLDANEIDELDQWCEQNLQGGWDVIDVGEPYFTNNWQLHNPFGDPKIRGGDVADYTIMNRNRRVAPQGPTRGESPVREPDPYNRPYESARRTGRALNEASGGEPVWGIEDYKRLGIIGDDLSFGEESMFDFRDIGYEFHGGMNSAFYSFASTDCNIYGPPHAQELIAETRKALAIANSPQHDKDFPHNPDEGRVSHDSDILAAMLQFFQIVLQKMNEVGGSQGVQQ